MSGLPVDFVFDYECIGPPPKGKIIELSYVPFIDDPYHPPTFMELVSRGRKYKFNLKAQTDRLADSGTIEWWRKQSAEAKLILKPSADDLELLEGHKQFLADLKKDGISYWQSLDYCRGPEFDRTFLTDILRTLADGFDTKGVAPNVFWNSRDVRTAIENRLLARGVTMVPLRVGMLDGFVKHDSIHDCAKDALMLIYARRYALCIEDAPEGDEIDEKSIQK